MKTVNTATNVELETVVELLVSRVEELLQVNTDILADSIHTHHHENKDQTKVAINTLKDNTQGFRKVLVFVAKHIVMSAVKKETPRTVLIAQIAELYAKVMNPTSRFRLAAIILKLFELTDAFTSSKVQNLHKHGEWLIKLNYKLSSATREELQKSVWKLPSETPVTKAGTAGHIKKITASNEHMMDVIEKLNSVAYTLDERVWNKFKYELAAYRFEDLTAQQAMVEEGDKLVGKTFYFNHRYGPDNGRIYCDGDLFTLQGGALNYVYKFTDKRVLTEEGIRVLREHVNELHSKASLSFKETVEYFSLTLDLIDAENGLPVGTILHKDAKLSGLQHQAISTRSHSLAQYCGLLTQITDGYNHIRSMLSNGNELTRDMVKCAYNPYQYGAGRESTIKPVLEMGGNLDYKEWEQAYAKAFPEAFDLRSFLIMLSSKYAKDTYTYTSPSGYNAVITALGTVETSISTVYGKLNYTRKEIDKDHMGVKLVAAFSHMQDAALLHYVVRKASYDMHVVHDSFGAHPNDITDVMQNYVAGLQEHLCMPILSDFVAQILADQANPEMVRHNVSKYISNTLKPSDIVGGLY